MPPFRKNPYGSFNFLVSFGGGQGLGELATIVGGFSEASGLGTETNYSDHRNGNEKFNTSRKFPSIRKFNEVTLKRGMTDGENFFK